jgi:uncharacterized protein YqgC (DUF456 family)
MGPMIAAVFIAVSGAGCVALVAVGLPGTWLMLGIAILIELVDRFYLPAASPHTFGWWTLGTCAVLSLAGELLETLTGAAGARRTGASKRGTLGAVIGGVGGAVAGAPFGLVVGSLLGGLLGTAVGALLGELSARVPVRRVLRPTAGAVAGRLIGSVSKIPFAIVIWLLLTVSAFR